MCFNKILCLLLSLLFTACLSAQDANTSGLDSFSAKWITAIRSNEKERVYLVTDKSIYKGGEHIWFNALLLKSNSQKWSSESKYLFVDIVDENDHAIKRMILDAANKQLYSRIQLPDTLSSGYYWLRAYTKQIAMQDTNNIAVQTLYVAGKDDSQPIRKLERGKEINNDKPVLTFYPEGGNMITGIDGTVAVAAMDKNGAPVSIAGVIEDSRDTVVTSFATNANGLGKFNFEPSGFRQYKAVINQSGKELSYPLPDFDFYKGQIGVTRQSGFYQLRILLGDSIYKQNTLSYVVGITRDSLVFAAYGKGLYQVNVEENKLPPGIVTFYLFDTTFRLLSERSVYVNNNNVQVAITTDKNSYQEREKVNLTVAVVDASQRTVSSLISIAVSDSLFANKQPCQITDINAIQAAGNLYFATHDCFSEEEKDLLMLTRSNTYETLTSPVQRTALPANDSLFYISGKVLNGKNEGSNKMVTLISSAGSDGLFYTDTTDSNGNFRFALDSYPDSMQYALEVKDFNNRVLSNTVQIDSIVFPRLKTPAALKQPLAVALKPATDRLRKQYNPQWYIDDGTYHLPPVIVKDEKKVDYDISKRVSPSSTILSGKDLDGRINLDNVILKVGGLQVINGYVVIRGLSAMQKPGPASEPLLIVDGVPVYATANTEVGNVSPVLSYLSTLNPKDIDFIEVLKDGGAANYGVRGANGVILINTTTQTRDLYARGSNMKVFYAKGVSRPALFPGTVYKEKDKKAFPAPDLRSTLFWNGHFITGDTGRASFILYTGDVPATYTVAITGVTVHGDIIYKTIQFKSK
jgi:TonB-dependent SusC/RagA subfamily outer membrane receptor